MFSGLLDAYTKELGEFVSTVREDTSTALSSAAARLQQRLGEEAGRLDGAGRGSRAGGGLPAAAPPPDLASYLAADLAHDAGFDDFRASFDLEARRELLESASAQCAEELERFVPDALTEDEFWVRYFYHQHMQRRARLLAGDLALPDDEELSWGDDEDGSIADAASEPGSGGNLARGQDSREPSDDDDDDDGEGDRAEDDGAAESGTGATLARSAKLVADEQAWEKQLAAISRQLERTKMRASLAEEKATRLEEELLETREEARQLLQENAELRAQLEAAPLDAPVTAQAKLSQVEAELSHQPSAGDAKGEGDADEGSAAVDEKEQEEERGQDEVAGDQDENAALQEVVAQPEAPAASFVNDDGLEEADQPATPGQEETKPGEKPQKPRSDSSSDEESGKEERSVPPTSESPPLSDGWQLEGAADGDEEEGWAAWE